MWKMVNEYNRSTGEHCNYFVFECTADETGKIYRFGIVESCNWNHKGRWRASYGAMIPSKVYEYGNSVKMLKQSIEQEYKKFIQKDEATKRFFLGGL